MIGEPEPFFVPISEFSFAAYPIQIHHAFRCLPETTSSPNQSRHPRRSVLNRCLSQLVRWACGKPTEVPAVDARSLEQAAP